MAAANQGTVTKWAGTDRLDREQIPEEEEEETQSVDDPTDFGPFAQEAPITPGRFGPYGAEAPITSTIPPI